MTGGNLLARLLGCANADNTNLIANASALNIDPLSKSTAGGFEINSNTNKAVSFVFRDDGLQCF